MGQLTVQLLAALSGPNPEPANVLEWTLGGTTYLYSKGDGILTKNGLYKGGIKTFGKYHGVLPFAEDQNIEENRQTFTLYDNNHEITEIVKGPNGYEIGGSEVAFKLLGRGVDYESWFTWNSGTIADFSRNSDGTYSFEVAGIHEKLASRVRTPVFTEVDFPDVDDVAQYKSCPLVLGKWIATGTNRAGLLPTYYIDDVNLWHCVGVGRYPDAGYTVWDGDGNQLTDVTDYAWSYKENGGRQYTVVVLVGAETLPITVACRGLTDTGLESGDVIENPAFQLQQVLAHWIFNDTGNAGEYVNGEMTIPSGTPIDTDSFNEVATFLDRSNATGSMNIDGDMTGEEILNRFCEEHNCYAYWNNNGLLTVAKCDPATDDIYNSSWPTFIYGERNVGEKLASHRFLSPVRHDEMIAKIFHDANVGDFLRQITVIDPDADIGSRIEVERYWSRAEI